MISHPSWIRGTEEGGKAQHLNGGLLPSKKTLTLFFPFNIIRPEFKRGHFRFFPCSYDLV